MFRFVLLVLFLSPLTFLTFCGQPKHGQMLSQKSEVPYRAVIAHRGASYYAPESTMAAYVLARDLGAHYLEADLQRTKDGVIICLHDDNLKRTTNVKAAFPDRADKPVSDFTLAELKQLDAGSWFNEQYPERAQSSYVGLKIVTLEELIGIAENGDNKPGIYLETKKATMFPGIEEDISKVLIKRKWLGAPPQMPVNFDPKNVGIGYLRGRVVLQTFEKTSLPLLHKFMPDVPTCFLLWLDDGAMANTTPHLKQQKNETYAQYTAKLQVTREEFAKWLDFAKENGATCTGPSTTLASLKDDNSYMELAKPWMNQLTHEKGMFVHVYTVDDVADMKRLDADGVDGFFTNRPDVLLKFYGKNVADVKELIAAHPAW